MTREQMIDEDKICEIVAAEFGDRFVVCDPTFFADRFCGGLVDVESNDDLNKAAEYVFEVASPVTEKGVIEALRAMRRDGFVRWRDIYTGKKTHLEFSHIPRAVKARA